MTLEPYYDRALGLYMIPGPVLLEIIATARRDEREACAKVVEESSLPDVYSEPALLDIAEAIRARGQE